MHSAGHQHGHGFSLRGWHASAAIGVKLLAVIAAITLFPYWSGWVTWTVAIHAALALVLLFMAGLALFRHGIAIRGSAHEGASSGVTIHGAVFYDVLASVMTVGRERRLRRAMLGVAKLRPGESVLDVACGTGTLAIAAAAEVGPAGEVVGVDASTQMLERATQKAARAGARARFTEGTAQSLPFPPARFNVVTGTLMLHHISGAARVEFAAEAKRVLKSGGRLVLVDFGSAAGGSRLSGLHAHGGTDPHEVAARLRDGGFRDVRVGQLGMMNLYSIEATA
ncbi:MAG: methyltransferase domain-containing protein [Mesorhizobium sp.]|nr:methyltransferase domain-containing protein [Mesorhizobium sp.]MCO5164211.1 methyltransferase domain-containing protein [Mesorhizobium sp.]